MPKATGLGQRLYVTGYNISGDVGTIRNINGGPQALDLTDITQSAYQRNGGLLGGAINFTSFFNVSAGRAHPVLSTLPRTDVMSTAATSAILGDPAASLQAVQIGYDGSRDQAGNFTLAVDTNSDLYPVEWGRLLTAGERTDTTATNGTGIDDTVTSTAFGGQAYLHTTAFTGTSYTPKLQDSADNVTFADLAGASFAAVTVGGVATSWQRIAFTGTVRRYVRVATIGTFSNAVFVVNFVRNQTAIAY